MTMRAHLLSAELSSSSCSRIHAIDGRRRGEDAADMVMLEKDLGVLADGVVEGRRIFSNTIKYVLMGMSVRTRGRDANACLHWRSAFRLCS
jgi:hypothetical protein